MKDLDIVLHRKFLAAASGDSLDELVGFVGQPLLHLHQLFLNLHRHCT